MNRSFFLKLISVLIVIAGFSVAYSYFSTPKIDTIEYSELVISFNTSQVVYETGEEFNVTVFMRNPSNNTMFVEPYNVNFFGYIKGEEITGIYGGLMSQTTEITEVKPYSSVVLASDVFKVSQTGELSFNFGELTSHVYIIEGFSDRYWGMMPELLDELPSDNKNPDVDFSHWFAVASKLTSLRNTGKLDYFPEIFVQMYPDWINGTAYVALVDTSEYFTQPILDQFSSFIREDIKFIKAPATLRQIEQWEQMIWDNHDLLEEHGVMVWDSSLFYDGRIILGVEDADYKKLEILKEILVDVPSGILVVYPSGPIILY